MEKGEKMHKNLEIKNLGNEDDKVRRNGNCHAMIISWIDYKLGCYSFKTLKVKIS